MKFVFIYEDILIPFFSYRKTKRDILIDLKKKKKAKIDYFFDVISANEMKVHAISFRNRMNVARNEVN